MLYGRTDGKIDQETWALSYSALISHEIWTSHFSSQDSVPPPHPALPWFCTLLYQVLDSQVLAKVGSHKNKPLED